MKIKNFSSKDCLNTSAGRNAQFFLNEYSDVLGCVGQVVMNPMRLCALVGPNIVAAAKHYPLSVGASIKWMLPKGVLLSTVRGRAATFGDLELYAINNTPVTYGIGPAEIEDMMPAASYANRSIIVTGVYGGQAVACLHKINKVMPLAGGAYLASYTNCSGPFTMEKGDSGAPDFILSENNDRVYYLGSHWAAMVMECRTSMASPHKTQITSLR